MNQLEDRIFSEFPMSMTHNLWVNSRTVYFPLFNGSCLGPYILADRIFFVKGPYIFRKKAVYFQFWDRIFYLWPPESAWATDLFLRFWLWKIDRTKKLSILERLLFLGKIIETSQSPRLSPQEPFWTFFRPSSVLCSVRHFSLGFCSVLFHPWNYQRPW